MRQLADGEQGDDRRRCEAECRALPRRSPSPGALLRARHRCACAMSTNVAPRASRAMLMPPDAEPVIADRAATDACDRHQRIAAADRQDRFADHLEHRQSGDDLAEVNLGWRCRRSDITDASAPLSRLARRSVPRRGQFRVISRRMAKNSESRQRRPRGPRTLSICVSPQTGVRPGRRCPYPGTISLMKT